MLLLAHLLKINHKELYLLEELEVSKSVEESYLEGLRKLQEGYPLQYLLGEWDFYGRSFYVEEGVLIPRPETEILVEEILRRLPEGKNLKGLEIGVGTGCISITLLLQREGLKMFANDINLRALRLAKRNAQRYGIAHRFFLFGGDIFEAIKPTSFDLILSNPPYIPKSMWESLPKVVKREGYSSLIGGEKGWEFYKRIKESIGLYLKEEGFFAFEIGHDQATVVKNLFEAMGYKIEIIRDYSGQDRVVIGWR
ncbi:MAG: peptide chain release factor N(5)-glutamine methyltransferase [Aquificaceae bacterium]